MPINPNTVGESVSNSDQEHPLSKMPSFEEHMASRREKLAPDVGTLTECYAERVVYTDKDGEEHRFAMTPVFLVDNALKSPDDMRVAGIALQHMAAKWRNDDRNPSRKVYADGSESGWENATRVDDSSDNILSEWAKNYFSADKNDSDSVPTADPGTLLRKYGERSTKEGSSIENPFSVINSGQYLDDPVTMFRLGKELSHMAKRWHEDQPGKSGQRATEPEYQTNESKQQITEPERKVEKSESEPQSAEEVFDHILEVLGSEKVEETYLSRVGQLADMGRDVTNRPIKDLQREFQNSFSNYQANRKPEYATRSKAALQSAKDNFNSLAQRNLISQDVAKAWLQQDFIQEKTSIFSCYNDIQHTEVSQEKLVNSWDNQKTKYRDAVASLVEKHPNAFWQSSNTPVKDSEFWADYDFIHVNADKNTGKVDLRCYITPDFTKDPSVVLDAWQGALEDTGLQDAIYFKVMGGLGESDCQRLDSIVVYKDSDTPDDVFRNCLETFHQRCRQVDPEALPDSPSKLPAATQEIAPGITIAPEPKFLNEILRTSAGVQGGKHFERHSWTTFVDRMMVVSMSLAANRLRSSQRPTNREAIYSEAKKCFRELMLLSKVNPDTMLPVEYGDTRPSWMELT